MLFVEREISVTSARNFFLNTEGHVYFGAQKTYITPNTEKNAMNKVQIL